MVLTFRLSKDTPSSQSLVVRSLFARSFPKDLDILYIILLLGVNFSTVASLIFRNNFNIINIDTIIKITITNINIILQ